MKLNLEVDFIKFTTDLISQLKTDYEAQPEGSVIRQIPLEDFNRSIQAIGDAADSIKPLNPAAFAISLNHYADCIKSLVQEAKEKANVRDS